METKDVLIGIAIGLAIAWLFGGKQQTQSVQTISSQQLSYMQNRMDRIEQRLFTQSSQYPQFSQPASFTPSAPITTPVATSVINTGYKNDEKWIIERGTDGHIKSLQIARDAKVRKIE